MPELKKNKICPFCRGRIKKLIDRYKCESCGTMIRPEAVDTRSLNSDFFNVRR